MVEKTVPDLFKNSNPPTLEVQRWPNRINIEKTTSRHILPLLNPEETVALADSVTAARGEALC